MHVLILLFMVYSFMFNTSMYFNTFVKLNKEIILSIFFFYRETLNFLINGNESFQDKQWNYPNIEF